MLMPMNVTINLFYLLTKLYDECIPVRKYKCKNKTEPRCPWISRGLLKSINTKNKLYKKYMQKPSEERFNAFKRYRNKLNTLIRKSKKEYYNKRFESVKNNLRKTWKTINSIIGRNKKSKTQTNFIDSNGCAISDPQVISEEFNNFFCEYWAKISIYN